jgi:molecular chaperone DnaK (HSP70)
MSSVAFVVIILIVTVIIWMIVFAVSLNHKERQDQGELEQQKAEIIAMIEEAISNKPTDRIIKESRVIERKEVFSYDVAPFTLSIETSQGLCVPVFQRYTKIPASKSFIWTTTKDNQSSIEIHIVQGENIKVNENRTLGKILVDGILLAPCGVPQIEVTFDIDANGILSVKSLDKNTGKEQKITITAFNGLSKNEIGKMQKEGDVHVPSVTT